MAITSEIADLIQRGGQIQGAGEAAKGQIWGNFLTNLAGVPAQIQRAKTERQEQQVRQMELTERQRQLQEQAQVRGILTQYGGDFEKAQQALAQVSPEWGVKAQQIASDAQAHRWEFESKQRQHDAELMEMRGRLAGSVTPETYPAFRQYVLKESPQDGAQLPIEWDPEVTPKILKGIQRKALTVAQQIQADEKEKADKRAEDALDRQRMRDFALEQGKQAAEARKLREPVKLGPGETLQQPQIDPATNAITGYTQVATGGPKQRTGAEQELDAYAKSIGKQNAEDLTYADRQVFEQNKEKIRSNTAFQQHIRERQFDIANPTPERGKSQAALEQEYRTVLVRGLSSRSGGLGLEDAKVQQANHLLALLDQTYDPKTNTYAIPKMLQSELALGLARLVSPGGQAGVQMMNEFQQRTAKGDIAGAISYITSAPYPATPQSFAKLLRDSIERQGSVAQENREGEMSYLRGLAPTDLDEARRKALEANSLNPLRQSRVIQNTATGERKIQISIDGGKTWK